MQAFKAAPFANCLLLLRVSDKSAVAAATEHEDDCKNDDPGAVVVEEITKTVVIHICFPPSAFGSDPLL